MLQQTLSQVVNLAGSNKPVKQKSKGKKDKTSGSNLQESMVEKFIDNPMKKLMETQRFSRVDSMGLGDNVDPKKKDPG